MPTPTSRAAEAAGGRAVLTDPALPSGSDRVHAALAELDEFLKLFPDSSLVPRVRKQHDALQARLQHASR